MEKKNLFINIIFILGLISGCTYDKTIIPTDCSTVHWTHNSSGTDQNHWPDLCTGYSACQGPNQSPVNITGAISNSALSKLIFNYSTTSAEIENNGHTIEFVCDPGSTLTIKGTPYALLQFHFHAESEHQLNGKKYPIEVHFVHKATDTDYAVVGIFFEEGAENSLFTKYLSHFPVSEGKYTDHAEIELAKLLPGNKSYFNYTGSLTTPPCSEVVNWYVLKQTVTASPVQVSQFKAILKNNFRNVQNLNGRKIFSFDE